MADAKRDANSVATLLAVSNADGITPVVLWADPTTHRLLTSGGGGSGSPGGSDTQVQYNNAGSFGGTSGLTTDGTNVTAVDANFFIADNVDATKKITFQVSGVTTGTTRTITAPDASGTMTLLGNTTTGSGSIVLATSPTLVTPTLGVASATTINKVTITAPATGSTLTIADGKTLTVSNTLTFTGTDGSSVAFGAGGTVLYTASTVPLTVGNTTIASGTSTRILYDNAGVLGEYTISGSGTVVAMATSPSFTTPTLGVASATTINKVTLTAPATGSTLTILDGKTLTVNKTLTLDGTDSTTMTFPTTSATIARTDAGQTFTGVNTFTSPKIITQISDTNGNALINIGATASAVNYVKITNAATGTAGPILSADGETNVDLKVAGKGTGAVHHTTAIYGDSTVNTDGATVTFDCSVSNIHTVTLGGNRTLAVSNTKAGECIMLELKQDGTGSRTVTWFSGISWAGGSAPTLTTTAGKTDAIGIRVVTAGSAYYGYVIGANI